MKILIVEDEKALSDSIVEYLAEAGHLCGAVYNYSDAIDKIEMYQYDCIVVDINLPDGNGLDLIRYIKKKSISLGIIIISALNSLENRIAHLKSINRRISFGGNNQIVANEIKLIPDEFKAYVNEKELTLTKKEYELLLFFISNKNKVITKSGLAEHLWGDYMDLADSYDFIYTHIKNLRGKLLKKGCKDYIKTIYGLGYKFEFTWDS